MLPKKEEGVTTAIQKVGTSKPETYDRISVTLNDMDFARIQNARHVKLRVVCPEEKQVITFLLKNKMPLPEVNKTIQPLDMKVDQSLFFPMLNPELTVLFQCNNVIEPFSTVAMMQGTMFSSQEPLLDMARKATQIN